MKRLKEIRRVREITRDEFEAEFVLRDVPVVVSGAIRDSAAVRTWSPVTLRERFGDAPALYKVSSSNAHPDFRAASLSASFGRQSSDFSEFLDRITIYPESERSRYLFTGDEQFLLRRREGRTFFNEHYAPLLEDLPVPELISKDQLYTIWAWFSGPGVRTWLHYDNNRCHNLNAQITGKKECWLFAPSALADLAPFPLSGNNPAYNCSQIDVDFPDSERWPNFESVPGLRATLLPGDLLFIPAYWFHTFFHHGQFNANLNFWWLPEVVRDSPVVRRQTLLDLVAAAKLDPAEGKLFDVLAVLERAVLSSAD